MDNWHEEGCVLNNKAGAALEIKELIDGLVEVWNNNCDKDSFEGC
jgi:hypothetical protein